VLVHQAVLQRDQIATSRLLTRVTRLSLQVPRVDGARDVRHYTAEQRLPNSFQQRGPTRCRSNATNLRLDHFIWRRFTTTFSHTGLQSGAATHRHDQPLNLLLAIWIRISVSAQLLSFFLSPDLRSIVAVGLANWISLASGALRVGWIRRELSPGRRAGDFCGSTGRLNG